MQIPSTIWAIDTFRLITGSSASGELGIYPKYDGWCVIVRNDGKQIAVSRNRKEIAYPLPQVPVGTLVAGELVVAGKDREAVPTAIATGKGAELVLTGVVQFAGDASVSIEEAASRLGIRCPEQIAVGSAAKARRLAIPQGCDGFIMRPSVESWPGEWYKIKPKDEVDLRVIGWEAGRNVGLAGSLIARSDDGKILAKIAGMTKEQKASVWQDFSAWNGRVVSVSFEKLYFDNGVYTLRHPRLSGVRYDKETTTSCQELSNHSRPD